MRITQSMMSQDLLRNLNSSYNKLSDLQQQLYTGKKISRPSQDPVVASLGIAYRSTVNQVNQYSRNMDEVHKWMDGSDSALDETNSVLQRIRELTVEASNDTYTDDQRQGVQKEVDQLKQQLVNIANTKVGDKYIFNGTKTTEAPVTLNSDGTVTTSYEDAKPDDVMIEVNDGIKIGVNVDPSKAFSNDLFKDINDLETALSTPGSDGKTIGGFLDKIDSHISDLTSAQAELGARENRADLIDNRLSDQKQSAQTLMSKNEDADFETVLVNFQTQQSVYQASLAVGARIIQPSLVDFLK